MSSQWLKDTARSAAASSGSWIVQNPLAAGAIVLFLIAALGGWGRAIERGRMADGILKAAADNTAKLKAVEKELLAVQAEVERLKGKVDQADRRVAESRKRLEEARRIARAEFRAPGNDPELLARYRALGFRGRVK